VAEAKVVVEGAPAAEEKVVEEKKQETALPRLMFQGQGLAVMNAKEELDVEATGSRTLVGNMLGELNTVLRSRYVTNAAGIGQGLSDDEAETADSDEEYEEEKMVPTMRQVNMMQAVSLAAVSARLLQKPREAETFLGDGEPEPDEDSGLRQRTVKSTESQEVV